MPCQMWQLAPWISRSSCPHEWGKITRGLEVIVGLQAPQVVAAFSNQGEDAGHHALQRTLHGLHHLRGVTNGCVSPAHGSSLSAVFSGTAAGTSLRVRNREEQRSKNRISPSIATNVHAKEGCKSFPTIKCLHHLYIPIRMCLSQLCGS